MLDIRASKRFMPHVIDVRAIIQQKSQDITVSTTCSPTGCCSAIATRGIDGRANT
jgi:hypothetical protein